jgi:transcriptional regulator with XRE-family HTH domain
MPKQIDKATVAEIRQAVANGETQGEIAKRYMVSPSAVCRIVNGSRHAEDNDAHERIEEPAESH